MRRRDFIKATAFLAAGGCVSPLFRETGRRPNMVFILADDLGWHQLSSYGSDFYERPNTDRLAS